MSRDQVVYKMYIPGQFGGHVYLYDRRILAHIERLLDLKSDHVNHMFY